MSDPCELDDFEAQLSAMCEGIDSQFSATLSEMDEFQGAAEEAFNPFPDVLPANKSSHKHGKAQDDADISTRLQARKLADDDSHSEAEDEDLTLQLSLGSDTDFEGTDHDSRGNESGALVNSSTSNSRAGLTSEKKGEKDLFAEFDESADDSDDDDDSSDDSSDDDDGHGHSHGGKKKCCDPAEKRLQRAQARKERKEKEKQLKENFLAYQKDTSLSGYVFKEDLTGFKAALASGQHHPHETDHRREHTALHHAVFHQEYEFIKVLMEYGCDINIRNFRGETPLMLAAKLDNNVAEKHNGPKMLSLLIEQYGADIHAKDAVGLHAFHHAAEQGRIWNLSLLHTVYGVDINIVDIYNKTALHWAGWAGHTRCVEWLLKRGCSPYVVDSVGCYALHWAAAKCRNDVLMLLYNFDASGGQSLGELRTTAEKTYLKQIRKKLYQDRLDYNTSEFVNNPESVRYDPNIPREKKRRALIDKNTADKYNNNDNYYNLQSAAHNPIDNVGCPMPKEYPQYKPLYEQMSTCTKDGLDVIGFAKKKNEANTGADVEKFEKTLKLLQRFQGGSYWSQYDAVRAWTNFVGKLAPLPVLYITLYFIALYLTLFVFKPIIAQEQPDLLWLPNAFVALWVLIVYNWTRLVITKPAKLTIFTPATEDAAAFGDDGSSQLSPAPPLVMKSKDINSVQEDGFAPTAGTKHLQLNSGQGPFHCLTFDQMLPLQHHAPIQKYNIQEYQNISTLYTLFVELMTTGKATETNCCYSCEIARPLRSKHCGRCNQCVPRFDHHCPFFNNDIAYSNYHNFLWFLILVPIHFVMLAKQYLLAYQTNNLNETTLPAFIFNIPRSFGLDPKWGLLGFHIFMLHYTMYLIFDIMLFTQHLYFLVTGHTTNEVMNKHRYGYLQMEGMSWNPFSRGGFFWNLLSSLALWRHKEPLCLTENQCRTIGFTPFPLDLAKDWGQRVKDKLTKKKKAQKVQSSLPNTNNAGDDLQLDIV